jgi:hypothetical protein
MTRRRRQFVYSTDAPPQTGGESDAPYDAEKARQEDLIKPEPVSRSGRQVGSHRERRLRQNPSAGVPSEGASLSSVLVKHRFREERVPAEPEQARQLAPTRALEDSSVSSALVSLSLAFNNVCRVKKLDDAQRKLLLTRFFAIALDQSSLESPTDGSPVELPDKAPSLWADRDRSRKQNPAQFIRAVYKTWFGKGLQRGHIRDLDRGLYQAFATWISRHPEDDIPELSRQSEVIDALLAELSLLYDPDMLRKLGLALQARQTRGIDNKM